MSSRYGRGAHSRSRRSIPPRRHARGPRPPRLHARTVRKLPGCKAAPRLAPGGIGIGAVFYGDLTFAVIAETARLEDGGAPDVLDRGFELAGRGDVGEGSGGNAEAGDE